MIITEKDASYHEAAIKYNVDLAEAAEKTADEVDHPVIENWCRAVARQHRRHQFYHERALRRITETN